MNIKELEHQIIKFRDDRNWKQFHTLKDLLLGLNIECSELSELFLWKSQTEIKEVPKTKIKNELADIYIFLSYLSNHFEVDLEKAIIDKIKLNSQKYPIDKSYGSNRKYNELNYAEAEKQQAHKNAYERWTTEDDEKLELLFCGGKTIKELSTIFARNEGAIMARIKKLELGDR